jgi:nucleoside 2-deoxyribosyltransferase
LDCEKDYGPQEEPLMERIYIAGPLFTSAERAWNIQLARLLEKGGMEVWLPQEHEPRELTAKNIFMKDVAGVDWADAIVAIMDGPDPDSGTCWEVGYGYATNKLIVLIRTDFRGSGEGKLAPYNLMLTESSHAHFEIPFATVDKVAEVVLDYFLKR